MKILIEFDGIVGDVRPAWYQAYSDAVRAIGLARCDEESFWRLVRSGADDGQLVRGAKPRHLEQFRAAFNESLQRDETLARIAPDGDAATILQALNTVYDTVVFTMGPNAAALRAHLTAVGLAGRDVASVPPGLSAERGAALGALARTDSPTRPAIVLCATDTAVRAAGEAGLVPIGIASGPVVGRRLEAAGARLTYPRIELFEEARRSGDAQLAEIGLATSSAPPRFTAPKPAPSAIDRAADRIRRRQQHRG